MRICLFISFFFILSLFSCSGKKDNSIITYQLNKSDYVEKLTAPGTVQAVVNTPVMAPGNQLGMMTVVQIVKDGEYVKKGDTLCVLSSPEAQSRYNQILTSIETLEAQLKWVEADTRLNIALLEATLAISEAQLKISSLDSLKMKYATDVQRRLLTLEMKKAGIEKQKTEKKLAATKFIGETDIRRKKAMIIQEKMKAQTLADQVSAMTIIAQHDGIVLCGEAPTIRVMSSTGTGTFGGPIREGSVILMPVPILQFPDLSRMQISADVPEADFKRIEKGQKVFITVDAAEKLITTGKVNRKSLARSAAQRYSASKVNSYEVIIDVDSCHSRMKPGLSSVCEIILKEEKDTLFVPTLAIFEKDSAKVVYVMHENKFIPVNIKTGISGSSFTIISGGLKGDEILALTEPPARLIASGINNKDTTENLNYK
jgi:multidrug efflux pump subunit AcrA (membrane-fusion protein)